MIAPRRVINAKVEARGALLVVGFSDDRWLVVQFTSLGLALALKPIALLVAIWLVATDKKVMCGQPSSMLSRVVVGLTIIAMFAAAVQVR